MQSSFLPGHGSTLPAARRTTPMAKLLSSYLRHLFLSPVSKPKPSRTKSLSSHRTGLLSPPLLQPTRTSTSSNRRRPPPIPCRGLAAMADGGEGASRRRWLEVAGEAVSTAFPVWVALSCAVGLAKPGWLGWVEPRWMVTGITVTMLGMGMTLTLDDLRGALAMPKELAAGFLLHYSVMPLSGYFVSKLLRLPSPYAAGLILVGCCAAATASNIVTYIARGNVALSVLMTAASTLAAVVTTPFLTAKLAGQYITVDAAALFLSTLQVVLLPVLAGAILNQYFRSIVKFVSPVMPLIAVGTTAVFIGKAIAQKCFCNPCFRTTSGVFCNTSSCFWVFSGLPPLKDIRDQCFILKNHLFSGRHAELGAWSSSCESALWEPIGGCTVCHIRLLSNPIR